MARLRVRAGAHERLDTPVSVPLGEVVTAATTAVLIEAGSGARLPAQMDQVGGSRRLRFILAGVTKAGDERAFDLVAGPAEPVVTVRSDAAVLEIRQRELPMLCYRKALVPPPAGASPLLARNAYLHPVWTPAGQVVTGDFAPSHPHQRGVFLAWTRTDFQGRQLDFWNLGKGTARVRSLECRDEVSGPVWGGFTAEHVHEDLKAPAGPLAVLRETWQIAAWAVGGVEAGWWLWDLTSVQETAGGSPLALPTYLYGGMAFRGSDAWTKAPWEFATAAGRKRADADATRAAWGDLSGPLGAAWAGLAMLGHPGNLRAPQPFRCHPSEPYFCMAPSRLGPWSIETGIPLTLRYRFLVHDGRADPALIGRVHQDFAEPPQVIVDGTR